MMPRRRLLGSALHERSVPLRGNMHRAIVIHCPDEGFSQAVFILRDDFLREEGMSRKELLQQARQAASGVVGAGGEKPCRSFLPAAALYLLGAATAVLLNWALRLI